mmetsp:Transcript_107029/g.301137  ORF Transcript_107029/g.301137 Transcript_107029/m.301137 type:complete len:376 (-) Transcript_107029:54-1181(-)
MGSAASGGNQSAMQAYAPAANPSSDWAALDGVEVAVDARIADVSESSHGVKKAVWGAAALVPALVLLALAAAMVKQSLSAGAPNEAPLTADATELVGLSAAESAPKFISQYVEMKGSKKDVSGPLRGQQTDIRMRIVVNAETLDWREEQISAPKVTSSALLDSKSEVTLIMDFSNKLFYARKRLKMDILGMKKNMDTCEWRKVPSIAEKDDIIKCINEEMASWHGTQSGEVLEFKVPESMPATPEGSPLQKVNAKIEDVIQLGPDGSLKGTKRFTSFDNPKSKDNMRQVETMVAAEVKLGEPDADLFQVANADWPPCKEAKKPYMYEMTPKSPYGRCFHKCFYRSEPTLGGPSGRLADLSALPTAPSQSAGQVVA